MIARLALALLVLLSGGALAQSGVPDHRWESTKLEDPAEWRAAVRAPKAVMTPLDLQMSVVLQVLCYPAGNGRELRLHFNDFDLGGETARLAELPVRVDNNAPVRLIWAGRGDWVSGPLPVDFIQRMRDGGFIVVEWGVYVPKRRSDPLRLHLRGARAAIDALPALCR